MVIIVAVSLTKLIWKGFFMSSKVQTMHMTTNNAVPEASSGHVEILLSAAQPGREYTVFQINADEEIRAFLFTLGCFEGQKLTVISIVSESFVVAIKDARYSIDADLASTITLL